MIEIARVVNLVNSRAARRSSHQRWVRSVPHSTMKRTAAIGDIGMNDSLKLAKVRESKSHPHRAVPQIAITKPKE